jgi:hypothetical protein
VARLPKTTNHHLCVLGVRGQVGLLLLLLQLGDTICSAVLSIRTQWNAEDANCVH